MGGVCRDDDVVEIQTTMEKERERERAEVEAADKGDGYNNAWDHDDNEDNDGRLDVVESRDAYS